MEQLSWEIPYDLSTNYDWLYEHLIAGKEVACFIKDSTGYTQICRARRFKEKDISFLTSGVDWGGIEVWDEGEERVLLIAECKRLELQFIPDTRLRLLAGGTYLNGMHSLDEMEIFTSPGIILKLSKHQWVNICQQIDKKIGKAAEALEKADKKFWKDAKQLKECIKELRSFLYIESGDHFFSRPQEEFDESAFYKLIKKYDQLLGFE